MSTISTYSAKLVIGVDLGLTGAISLVTHDNRMIFVCDMPVYKVVVNKKKRKKLDLFRLREIMIMLDGMGGTHCVIEDVHPMGAGAGTGVGAAFSLGYARAAFEAVCCMIGMQCIAVTPSVWKRHYGLLKTEKTESIAHARMIFDNADDHLKLIKHHGRAESMLIGGYYFRMPEDKRNETHDARQVAAHKNTVSKKRKSVD